MPSVSSLLDGQIILPLVQAPNEKTGVDIVSAMVEAGLKSVEVVLRTPASLAALREIKREFPTISVGAGTVLDEGMLSASIDAGADYIVTPAITENLLKAIVAAKIPAIPGTSKPSDILLAYQHGLREMKLFPAELSGGAPFLKAIGAVFQDVRFCPTGGVSAENRGKYLALSNVFAVGGSWVAPEEWVSSGNWSAITQACREANLPAFS